MKHKRLYQLSPLDTFTKENIHYIKLGATNVYNITADINETLSLDSEVTDINEYLTLKPKPRYQISAKRFFYFGLILHAVLTIIVFLSIPMLPAPSAVSAIMWCGLPCAIWFSSMILLTITNRMEADL